MQERKLVPIELYTEYKNVDKWAVIVGISQYQHQSWNLKYADRDAEKLYRLLLTENGGNFKEQNIYKLTNEEATTRNIRIALHDFLQKPDRADLVLIYFACHGTADPNRPQNLYLLTHDTEPNRIAGTALPMREIDFALRETLLAEKIIVLADTCHSGGIGGRIGKRNAGERSELMNRYLHGLSNAKGGIALLTSAEAREVSREGEQWGGGHGVFTHFVLEGMEGTADRDRDGIVTVGELFEYVRDKVKQETDYRQHPSIGSNEFDRNLPIAIANPEISRSIVDRAAAGDRETHQQEQEVNKVNNLLDDIKSPVKIEKFTFEVITVDSKGKEIKREPKEAEYYTEDLGSGVNLDMVYIPKGSFLMGSPKEEQGGYGYERPQHRVNVPSFSIGRYPITQGQWKAVAEW